MVCTFIKLFWQMKPAINCAGAVTKLSDLKHSADAVLRSNKCFSVKDPPISMLTLFLNRLTPFILDPESVHCLDVCSNHLVGIIVWNNWKYIY